MSFGVSKGANKLSQDEVSFAGANDLNILIKQQQLTNLILCRLAGEEYTTDDIEDK